MNAGKHLSFLRELKQIHFKSWLDKNALKVLSEIGVGKDQIVLDFGCGSGTYSIASARLVGKNGGVYSMDVSQNALKKLSTKAEDQNVDNISTVSSTGTTLPRAREVDRKPKNELTSVVLPVFARAFV